MNSLKLPDKLVVEAVGHFNMLRAYPMGRDEVIAWAQTLERVVPDLDPLAVCWLVDEMLAGRYEYDKNAGIQNLTQGLMKVERVGDNFQFKTDFPG
jgi:hypothetical protein